MSERPDEGRESRRLGLGIESPESPPAGPWERFRKSEMGPWIAYTWARAGEILARILPEALAPPVISVLQLAYGKLSKRRMLMMRRHLQKVAGPLGEKEIEVRMGRALALYARYWYETFRLPSVPPPEILASFESEGEEFIESSLDRGKGLIVALPHLGNWDVAGCYISQKYSPVLAVAEYLRPPRAFEHWKRTRERLGMRIVPLDGTATPVREAMKHLRGGGIVGLVADRMIGTGGVEVEFFGEVTRVPAGPAALARRSGADLMPAGLYMLDGGRHLGILRPPVEISGGSDVQEDVAVATRALAREFEALIRRDPEQWHLFTPFWPSDWKALGTDPPF